ncbi:MULTISPECIES: D-alanyl-D-alanine carboxypeptidase family protein [unclassified Novosphingobium]|nr:MULTISPECIES: D-alanyl-D-alanine carboxypeptidase family protein [unclassified Novosphingobium]
MKSPHVQVSADPAHPPEVVAPIALLIDVNSGRVLFERQSHRRFVPASLTKIMTSYVAFELAAQGKLKLDASFAMRPETFRQWHGVGSTMFLENNSQTRVADLLEGIVTVSANDACVVLAEGVSGNVPGFTALMNAQARTLGMRDTHYNTPNGWMDEGRTYVSAADLATLSTALITRHPDLYRRFYGHETMIWNGIEQRNHNPLYGVVNGADGVKTGFTNEAGYGLVGSAQRNGRRLMMVVGGYDRPQDRARDGAALIEWGFAAFDEKPLFAAGDHVGSARVQGGTISSVGLVAPRSLAMLVGHGQTVRPTLSIRYKGPLRAPIAKGQEVATLVVHAPGQPDARLPLAAAEAVPKGGLFDRLRNGFAAMAGQ